MKYQLDGREITREEARQYAEHFGYEFEALEASMIRFIEQFSENDRCDWFGLAFIR